MRVTIIRAGLWLAGFAAVMASTACTPAARWELHPDLFEQGETFGYRKWVNPRVEPDVVVIGIHGFCGAAVDYRNLGEHLMSHQPRTALYAYELRGQGGDPIPERRGDIGDARDWYRDLQAFTGLVRERHPKARIVWFGESMGALIAVHAWCEAPADHKPCDAMVLSSPIVRLRDDIPEWKPALLKLAALALPRARISLQTLMQGEDVQMTEGAGHLEQAAHNPWNIDRFTLRLIDRLTSLIGGMEDCAPRLDLPVLILHGECDDLNSDRDIRSFVKLLPDPGRVAYHNYPGAYHLLMYDRHRRQVFRDIRHWVDALRRPKP